MPGSALLFAILVAIVGRWIHQARQARTRRPDLPPRRVPVGESPMPAGTYDLWSPEAGLTDPVRLPLDDALAELARRFAASGAAERDRMRRAIGADGFDTLLSFARRAAVFAVRERSAAHLADGLAAVALVEEAAVDPRDVSGVLGILRHGAERIGADAGRLFGDAAAGAEPATARLIRHAARPEAAGRGLEAFGFVEVETRGGVGLVRWDLRPYAPTLDLARAALELAALFDADRYRAYVGLAAPLTPAWLREPDDASVERAVAAVRACAMVNAFPRPESAPDHEGQWITAFLAEAADEDGARTLLAASEKARRDHDPTLAVAEGRLFCLVVAEAMLPDARSVETAESLARFSDGIARIVARHARPA